MPVTLPIRVTPILGPGLTDAYSGTAFYDGFSATSPSYPLGTRVTGSDGGTYVFVQASADIAATSTTGRQVTLTYPANTVATGSGGYYTQPGVAVTSGEYIHVRQGAFNAVPT